MREIPEISWVLEQPNLNLWFVAPHSAARGMHLMLTVFVGSGKTAMP